MRKRLLFTAADIPSFSAKEENNITIHVTCCFYFWSQSCACFCFLQMFACLKITLLSLYTTIMLSFARNTHYLCCIFLHCRVFSNLNLSIGSGWNHLCRHWEKLPRKGISAFHNPFSLPLYWTRRMIFSLEYLQWISFKEAWQETGKNPFAFVSQGNNQFYMIWTLSWWFYPLNMVVNKIFHLNTIMQRLESLVFFWLLTWGLYNYALNSCWLII